MFESVSDYLIANWIGILALLTSLILLYLGHLRRFRLEVHAGGRISVTRNPFNLDESALAVDLILSNEGSQRGVVETIALHVNGVGLKVVYAPHLEFQSTTLSLGEELAPADLTSFRAIQLGKAESVTKRILFRSATGGPATLPAGVYQIEVFVISSRSKEWRKVLAFEMEIEPEDVSVIESLGYVRQPDGRNFLNWQTRDKLLRSYEQRYKRLGTELAKGSVQ